MNTLFVFMFYQEHSFSSTRGVYGAGDGQERFRCIEALVFFQCVVNYLFALGMSKTVLQQGEDTTKSSYYAISSFTYLLAMVTRYKALSLGASCTIKYSLCLSHLQQNTDSLMFNYHHKSLGRKVC